MTVLAKSSAQLSSEPVRSLYEQLCTRVKDVSYLQGVAGLLHWDQEVMMPSKAGDVRAKQLSAIAGLIHEAATSPALGSILEELQNRKVSGDLAKELNNYELANVRLASKAYKEATVLPSEHVKENAALDSKAVAAWAEVRKESDFSKFAPFLEDQVRIVRQRVTYKLKGGVCEEARKINEKARTSLGLKESDECYKGYYQALLNDYETGFKDEHLQALFSDLKKSLVPLIAKIRAKNFQHDNSFIQGEWDVKKQAEFSHRIAKEIGFDTEAGRLDVSTHPFTGGAHPTDVRMTTRYTADYFQEGISGTIHETGHSLYEQGRNLDYDGLPVSQALSLGIHESQSLLWERMVGLSEPFWTYVLPLLKEQFQEPSHENLQSITPHQFYNAFNRVEPGFIRIEADEVTYPMHIILRYEIEKALVEGDITVAEVPRVWNAKMKEYLDLEVKEDRLGCLQDTHWAVGLIGYFPTYTLGSIYAVQIFNAAKQAIPDLDEHLVKGEFHVLKKWLNENIHRQGSLKESGDDLIRELTGKPLDSNLYVQYLTDKYTKIYDL
ncbi:M32 carboxypeptidase Taq metallopeptidase peptidase [Lobosporangium transversale]|uniref:M32 carboxypeptidase Taq metallopeptidase peptidase n=1 Tax=Lobosporangium transversale TaxID=64571 RepID=A0A1Y2H3X8_9FUNG|nr:M32 carboxypeptidase Taq metallopeptidase peptidase [Lobosporangium transversale]ORZ27762.1 M32 carboxypeptidase Taq metallopeptidase peptidase [Lobosporangium transversale]|eukprot:XP_021885465.1 M32 carboxypeptidase Taq metallopeptidase peptidase [Lobosporangium transversale]